MEEASGCVLGYQRPLPPRDPPRPPPPPPKPPRPPPPRRSPPPPAPGAFAFSTWIVRPSRLVPLRRLMACSASSGVAISTKPKPRDRPVSRSVTTLADSTLPVAAKASRRRSFEVENERPPTKSLTAMEGLLLPSEPVRDPELGRRSGTRPDGEEGSRRTDDRTRQPKYTLVNNLRYRL